MQPTLQFRTATLSDVTDLVTLVNSAYRGESSKAGWTTEESLLGGQRTDERKMSEMIRDHRIEVAIADQKIIGCVYLERENDTFYLGMLTVNPYIQAKGIGKSLLRHAEELARQTGLRRIRMTVIDTRHELLAFYDRRGYKLTGRTEPFPMDDPDFGLPKVSSIQFQELEKIL